jgi:hypothetical protein
MLSSPSFKEAICLEQFSGLEFLFVVLEDLSLPEKLSKELSKMVCFLLFAKPIRGLMIIFCPNKLYEPFQQIAKGSSQSHEIRHYFQLNRYSDTLFIFLWNLYLKKDRITLRAVALHC